MLDQLGWHTLQQRRQTSRAILLHKIVYGKVAIQMPSHYSIPVRHSSRNHPLHFYQVQSWRTGASMGWTVLSLPVMLAAYSICCHLKPFSPLTWLTESVMSILSGAFVIHTIILVLITILWCIVTCKTFKVVPEVVQTQMQKVLLILRITKVLHGVVCVMFGVLCSWVCSSVIGGRYSHLTNKSVRNEYMLNEYHIFLITYGIYSGFCFFIFHYLHQNYYLQFPILQQPKYFHVRSHLSAVFVLSCRMNVFQTALFYPMYWMFGHIPKDCIADVLGLQRSEVAVNSLYGLLDVGLLWQTSLCGFLIHFILSFASMIYRIYNAQHYAFMIESSFEEQKNHCLIDALQCQTSQLIKYLGYLDLCHLSKYSPERRQQVFSLSQPGGHPHNWNKLCGACLKELSSLNEKLEDFNWKVFASVPVRPKTAEKNNMSGDLPASTLTYRGTMANGVQKDTQHQPTLKEEHSFSSNILHFLKKKPLFSSLLSEIPDAKSRQLFADVQIHIWASEALSNLAAASYTEDKYGVVQRSLPDIINTIISLHENVEKHFKLASTGVRRHQKDTGALDAPLKYLLQTTLKASVYQMIQVFGKHILNLPISPDTLKKMKQFLDYRE